MTAQFVSKESPAISLSLAISFIVVLFLATSANHLTQVAHKQTLSELDNKIYCILNSKRPGLTCTFELEAYPVVVEMLALPEYTDVDFTLCTVYDRLADAREKRLSAHDEACLVLGVPKSIAESVLLERIRFLNGYMACQRANDARFGTHEGSPATQ